MSAEYCIAFISLIAIATLRSPSHSHSHSHSLALPCLFSCVLTPAHVSWIYPFALPFGLCLNLVRIIALVPGLPLLSSPLDIVRRSPTTPVYLSTLLSCPLYTCLLFFRPCLLLTTPRNKSLQMDPLASPRNRILGPTRIQRLSWTILARYVHCKTIIIPQAG